MTSQGKKTRDGIKKVFVQNVLLIILHNSNQNRHFIRIMLSCSKRRWIGKISEIRANYVTNDVIGANLDIISK